MCEFRDISQRESFNAFERRRFLALFFSLFHFFLFLFYLSRVPTRSLSHVNRHAISVA